MQYLDFDLSISGSESSGAWVSVVHSPAGEGGRESLRLPFQGHEMTARRKGLENAILLAASKSRRAGAAEEITAREFGLALRNSLLTGRTGRLFETSLQRARLENKRLRFRLRIESADLADLPWEFLYDEDEGEYLALQRDLSFVRFLELAKSIEPLTVKPPLRILCMAPSPDDLDPLDADSERRLLGSAVSGLEAAGLVEVHWLERPTWRALHDAMVDEVWHVLHFVGHGEFDARRDEGVVYLLREESTRSDPLTATQLGRLLSGRDTRLVFLNCCDSSQGSPTDLYSSVAGTLVRRGIPAVIAMQYAISDPAALQFARTFYNMIARQRSVDEAIAEARVAVSLVNSLEWGVPVLFMRTPDGVLFNLPESSAPGQAGAGEPVPPPAARPRPKRATPRPRRPAAGARRPAKTAPAETAPAQTAPPVPAPPVPAPDRVPSAAAAGPGEGRLVLEPHWTIEHPGSVTGATFSRDGRLLLTGCRDGTARLCDVEGKQVVHSLEGAGQFVARLSTTNASTVAATATSSQVSIWDLTSRTRVRTIEIREKTVTDVALSNDGRHVAVASANLVRLYDTGSGAELARATEETVIDWDVNCVAFSRDDRFVATASLSKFVMVFQVPSLKRVRSWSMGFLQTARRVAFSPDGRLLAACGTPGARIYDVTTGQPLRQMGADTRCLAFDRSGELLALASGRNVRLVAAASGRTLAESRAEADVVGLDFGPDGPGPLGGRALLAEVFGRQVRVQTVRTTPSP